MTDRLAQIKARPTFTQADFLWVVAELEAARLAMAELAERAHTAATETAGLALWAGRLAGDVGMTGGER